MDYLDDVSVLSETPEEHFDHLQQVLNWLRKHGLKLNLPKCQFLSEETKYLDFVINKDGQNGIISASKGFHRSYRQLQIHLGILKTGNPLNDINEEVCKV